MKRLILLCLLAALLLCSCVRTDNSGGDAGSDKSLSPDTACAQVLDAVKATCKDLPDAENVYLDTEGNLDSEMLSLHVDGTFTACEEFDLLEGYAIYACGGTVTFEIDVLKAKDEAGAESLCALLERRTQTMRAGDKAMYDPNFEARMKEVQIFRDGVFAILLLTDDTQAARTAINALK